MDDFLKPFIKPFADLARETPAQVAIRAIDILLVAYVIYRVLALIRGTRVRIVAGVLVFSILLVLSNEFHLEALNWLLEKAALLAPVALVILLLPELRQALEGVGKVGGWERLVADDSHMEVQAIEDIVAASAEMSAGRVGALMVIEKATALNDIVGTGVPLDARLSAALLGSIFYEGNPLHDGAAIVRGNCIVAAACRLPLSDSTRLDANYHMRHRAAIGLTEMYDAIVVVISEERGTISIAKEGEIFRLSGPAELRDALKEGLRDGIPPGRNGQKKRIFHKSRQLK